MTDKEKLTITPSLQHRINRRAHYVFTEGFANILKPGDPPKDRWYKTVKQTHAPGSCPL